MDSQDNPTIREYDRRFNEFMKNAGLGIIPHCDHRILHSPENGCIHCNDPKYTHLHQIRKEMKLRYTGESLPEDWDTPDGWQPCPSEQRRDLETIEKWYGNVPRYE